MGGKLLSALLKTGRVLKRMRGFYYVDLGEPHLRLCRIKGSLFQKKAHQNKIAVGDWVGVDPDAAKDSGLIHKILPRQSQLARSIRENRLEQILVSNVDQLFIVSSILQPHFSFGLVDRFIVAGLRGNLNPILILNKTDLVSEKELLPIQELYASLQYPVLLTSVPDARGIESLRTLLKSQTSVFFGHSGVGKSSLLKALFPDWKIRIGAVDEKRNRGRHTTTLAEMYRLPNEEGYLVDTPGIRELALPLRREELASYFVEFLPFLNQCHFKNCLHLSEPECVLKNAVESELVSSQRYHSYCSILASLGTEK